LCDSEARGVAVKVQKERWRITRFEKHWEKGRPQGTERGRGEWGQVGIFLTTSKWGERIERTRDRILSERNNAREKKT